MTPGQSNLQTKDLSNNETQSQTNKYKREVTKKPGLLLTNDVNCGVSMFESTQSLTTGGKEVSRGEWPWYVDKSQNDSMIYLFIYRLVAYFHKNEFNCGGNLISKKLVITAGEIKYFNKSTYNHIQCISQLIVFKTNVNLHIKTKNHLSILVKVTWTIQMNLIRLKKELKDLLSIQIGIHLMQDMMLILQS